MSINDVIHFDKTGEPVRFPLFKTLFLAILIILIALLAFGLGRLSSESGGGVKIETPLK